MTKTEFDDQSHHGNNGIENTEHGVDKIKPL
jgi:hypothetical protein